MTARPFGDTEPGWHELPVDPPTWRERFRGVLDALLMLAVFVCLGFLAFVFGRPIE